MAAELEREDDYPDSPEGWAKRWSVEFDGAKKWISDWHKEGDSVEARFLDDRKGGQKEERRLNLFTSDTITKRSLMYGKPPRSTVGRRFGDAQDDVARVAGEMLERTLNTDIERSSDGYATALGHGLIDFLVPGLAMARLRYVADWAKKPAQPAKPGELDPLTGELKGAAPEVPEQDYKSREDVETDYVHWKDSLWSPSRVFNEWRWWSHKSLLSRSELVAKFGAAGKLVPLNAKQGKGEESRPEDPWSRAEVWEIWDKEHKKVFWFVEGYDKTLTPQDVKDEMENGGLPDPLGLEGFWPFARPMMANLLNSKCIPRSDYKLFQDQYLEVDQLTKRIELLTDAVKVSGVYDKTAGDLQKVMESSDNRLHPADSWGMLAEKGGLPGVITWFPLDQIVAALDKLREVRAECIAQLHQVSGMADIVRGQATHAGATATEQRIKAQFGSVRMQAMQDEFARWASDTQRIRAEIICKHFDVATIIERSNVQFTADAPYAQPAAEFLKSNAYCYRVEVKPEAIAMQDFAADRQEGTEFLQALGGFIQAAAPVGQVMGPQATPSLLQLLQIGLSKFRFADQAESVLDQAIASAVKAAQAAAQNPQPKQPDPKVVAAQMKLQSDGMKAQADMQKVQAELQADLVRDQSSAAADAAREKAQAEWGDWEKQREDARNAMNATRPPRLGNGRRTTDI